MQKFTFIIIRTRIRYSFCKSQLALTRNICLVAEPATVTL